MSAPQLVRGAPALPGDLPLAFRIHPGKAAPGTNAPFLGFH